MLFNHFSDTDECGNTPSPCHPEANCANTAGSFTCTCKSGYTGSGVTCTGMNSKIALNNRVIVLNPKTQ